MKQLVIETERAWQSLGKISYGATEAEKASTTFRRSLYIVEDMEVGEIFTSSNLKAIRPGFGLPPKYYEMLLGKQAKILLKRGTPLTWAVIG